MHISYVCGDHDTPDASWCGKYFYGKYQDGVVLLLSSLFTNVCFASAVTMGQPTVHLTNNTCWRVSVMLRRCDDESI